MYSVIIDAVYSYSIIVLVFSTKNTEGHSYHQEIPPHYNSLNKPNCSINLPPFRSVRNNLHTCPNSH